MKGTDRKCVRPVQKVLKRRVFGGLSPFLCYPEKWSGLNRISHPHWVKICDDHNGQINLRANKNTKFFLLHFKRETEFILIAAQNDATRINYV